MLKSLTLELCTEDPDCGPPLPSLDRALDVVLAAADHTPSITHADITARVHWSVESEDPSCARALVTFVGTESDLLAVALGYCAGDPTEAQRVLTELTTP